MVNERNQRERTYALPVSLVNAVLASVVGAVLAVGGYMVRWNRDDLAYKQAASLRLDRIENAIGSITRTIDGGVLPRADERIRNLEARLGEVIRHAEVEQDKLEQRIRDVERGQRP